MKPLYIVLVRIKITIEVLALSTAEILKAFVVPVTAATVIVTRVLRGLAAGVDRWSDAPPVYLLE